MDEHAQAVRATPREEGEYSDCVESDYVGPYKYGFCDEGTEGGGWVAYYQLESPGFGDEGSAGLLYAPGGPPNEFEPRRGELAAFLPRCSNHLSGNWYEMYSPRGTNGCNWGLSESPSADP